MGRRFGEVSLNPKWSFSGKGDGMSHVGGLICCSDVALALPSTQPTVHHSLPRPACKRWNLGGSGVRCLGACSSSLSACTAGEVAVEVEESRAPSALEKQ